MPSNASVIALPEMTSSAGLITWWKLSGDVDLQKLSEAWEAAGLDSKLLPSPPSEQVALRRALKSLFEKGSSTFIQVVPGGTYAVIDVETRDTDDDGKIEPTYKTRFKAWLDDNGVVRTSTNFEGTQVTRQRIWQEFQRLSQCIEVQDMSAWLVKQADAAYAVRLRDTGGIYFVPETRRDKWQTIAGVVESVSKARVFEIPAMRTEKALGAILDAMSEEASAELAKIEADLDKGELGARALKSRQNAIGDLLKKVESYERLLNTRLDSVHDTAQRLETRYMEAVLVSE